MNTKSDDETESEKFDASQYQRVGQWDKGDDVRIVVRSLILGISVWLMSLDAMVISVASLQDRVFDVPRALGDAKGMIFVIPVIVGVAVFAIGATVMRDKIVNYRVEPLMILFGALFHLFAWVGYVVLGFAAIILGHTLSGIIEILVAWGAVFFLLFVLCLSMTKYKFTEEEIKEKERIWELKRHPEYLIKPMSRWDYGELMVDRLDPIEDSPDVFYRDDADRPTYPLSSRNQYGYEEYCDVVESFNKYYWRYDAELKSMDPEQRAEMLKKFPHKAPGWAKTDNGDWLPSKTVEYKGVLKDAFMVSFFGAPPTAKTVVRSWTNKVQELRSPSQRWY